MWPIITVVVAIISAAIGYRLGRRSERRAGDLRLALVRRYHRPESGATAVQVVLGLIAVGTAYVAGHLLVWSLGR